MTFVLTLIAGAPGRLDADAVTAKLEAAGARTGAPDWLSPGRALDLPFDGIDPQLAAELARTDGIDAVAQPAAGRRKKLLVADMESTVIENEMLDDLAALTGIGERIAAITRRAMNGEIDFEGALRERVGLLKGVPVELLERAYAEIRIVPGAPELVATMRCFGATCALVSGGFRFFTGRIRQRLGFDLDQANELEIDGDKLAGTVREPILGRATKLEALERLAGMHKLQLQETMAVGDGANDLAMLGAAGLGVAFRAKPAVAATAKARIDHGDLIALLYLQGYRDAEIVRP
jgi:phosphoserine phosphatase